MKPTCVCLVLAVAALGGLALPVGKPAKAGGAHTLYPRRITARYDAAGDAYAFEFDQLEAID